MRPERELICHWRTDEGFPQLPSFHAKSQVLEIHKHKKHFKMSPNKEAHKVEVLT
jgi:hypothetical protein